MSKNRLIIFTRNPELGKVKTRLAASIGDEKALKIYTFLLNKTKEATLDLTCNKVVYYSVKIRQNDLWNANFYEKRQQQGNDLGERMENAFKDAFAQGYEKVIIIGSDLYDLTPNHIHQAFKALTNNDAVIGPAKDGGYYLLGMKTLHATIFKNKKWGTSTVRKETLKDLKNTKIHLLEELNDIDVYEDLKENDLLIDLINQK